MRDDADARDHEDAQLIQRGEYALLLAKYESTIFEAVRVRLRNADADDVAQQVMVSLWTRLRSGRPLSASFWSVMWRRIRWAAYDYYEAKPPATEDVYEHDPPGEGPIEVVDYGYLRQLLASLPPREADVARLLMLGYDAPAIAEQLRLKTNAVYQIVFRVRARLGDLIPRD